jgi:histone H3/H4
MPQGKKDDGTAIPLPPKTASLELANLYYRQSLSMVLLQRKATGHVIPYNPMSRMVKGIGEDSYPGFSWAEEAIALLGSVYEDYMVTLLGDARLEAVHRGGHPCVVCPRDPYLANEIGGGRME